MKIVKKILLIVWSYPILFYYVYSEKQTLASILAEQIVKKIGQITESHLSKALPEEQQNVIEVIKGKLDEAGKQFGDKGQKYVKLVMEGVKLMTLNYGKGRLLDIRSNIIRESASILKFRKNADNKKKQKSSNRLVRNIANRVQLLSDKYIRNAKTVNDKIKVLSVIRNRILELSKQKYVSISGKGKPSDAYSDFVAKGVDLAFKKYIPSLVTNNMKMYTNQANSDSEFSNEKHEMKYKNRANEISEIDSKNVGNEVITTLDNNEENDNTELMMRDDCDSKVRKFCFQVSYMNKLSCSTMPIIIPMDKLCDDTYDCPDHSDENNCLTKVVNRIKKINKVISSDDTSTISNCFSSFDPTLLLSQSRVLNSVIIAQIEFLKKFATNSFIARIDNRTLHTTANEVAILLDSLALALSGALCFTSNEDEAELPTRRFNDIIDIEELDEELKEKTFKPANCLCDGKDCVDTDCNKACLNICLRKYDLARWACRVVDGETSISLDYICDGKPDCADESDETGCNYLNGPSKFEAIEIYNTVMKLMQEKELAKEFRSLRNQILAMENSVKDLLMFSTNSDATLNQVKKARNECFSAIVSTYNESVAKAYTAADIEDIYDFLLSVNEKLVAALKHSNTGNERTIHRFQSDSNCVCKSGKCVANCKARCVRYCEAKPKLTKYFCNDPNTSKTIIIEKICDGKQDCPNGRDEFDCKKNEFCRRQHIVMLNNLIKKTVEMQKYQVIGEILEVWTKKVNTTLRIIGENEFDERPNLKVMKRAVVRIIADLLKGYVSFENRRRQNNFLTEFTSISQIVMETLKTCGK